MTPVPVNALDLREKLITVKQAAPMVPFTSARAMRNWLDRYTEQFPPRWMCMGRRYVRMVTLTEVAMVRSMRLARGAQRAALMRAEHAARKRVKP